MMAIKMNQTTARKQVQKVLPFGFLTLTVLVAISMFPNTRIEAQSSQGSVLFVGRVISETGVPLSNVDVFISPFYQDASKVYDLLEVSTVTDSKGVFRIKVARMRGQNLYFYSSKSSFGEELLSAPFSFVSQRDRKLLGIPITERAGQNVDLGDMPLLFRFGTISIATTFRKQSLKENDWQRLWVVVRNEKGKVITQRSIGPNVELPKIDLSRSVVNFSLPEGKWSLEFRSFDEDLPTGKSIGSVILFRTPLFKIDANEITRISMDINRRDLTFPFKGAE